MSERTANLITTPFTRQQVTALNAYQTSGPMHPFTCGGKRRFGRRCVRVLIATPDGWRCPRWTCTYRQDWAHGWMAAFDWTLKEDDGDD
jgi:hypothetical protein